MDPDDAVPGGALSGPGSPGETPSGTLHESRPSLYPDDAVPSGAISGPGSPGEIPSETLPEAWSDRYDLFPTPYHWYRYYYGSALHGISMPPGSTLKDRVIAYMILKSLPSWTPPSPEFGDNWL